MTTITTIARLCHFLIWGGAISLTLVIATDTPNRWGALFFVLVFFLFAAALSTLVHLVSRAMSAMADRRSLNH